MKNICFRCFSISVCLILLQLLIKSLQAQTEIYNSIRYSQITTFEEDYSIVQMKMSADATKIIFSTAGSFVKVYTINVDGSGLMEIYDFQTTGFGPFVDISANGDKVIWYLYGKLFIANSNGSSLLQLVPLLPHPNPIFADFVPDIPLPPRITSDGSQIYFIIRHNDVLASGVWRVNSDGSGVNQLFNYLDIAADIFGSDGSEYSPNAAFTDGFDISGNGSKLIVGSKLIKITEGDYTRGHAIVFDGYNFYNLGEFASGYQPFCTDSDGAQFLIFRKEYNDSLKYDELNVYFDFIGSGDPIKVINSIDIFGTAANIQLSSNGSTGIVFGANGRIPITLVDRITSSHLDLVNIDGVSRAIGNFNFSESTLPSINANGDRICFLSNSIPKQIWTCSIGTSGAYGELAISEIFFEPNYILKNVLSRSHFKAHIASPPNTIHVVTAETFQNGTYKFRGIDSDIYSFYPRLVDDGTLGDNCSGDNYFHNNSIFNSIAETPIGEYTIRIAAANSTLKEITAVDAGPFFILYEDPVNAENKETIPTKFSLAQNYPNPFNSTTNIEYFIPYQTFVNIRIFDLLGKEIKTIIKKEHPAGAYSINFECNNLSSGIYFYGIVTNDYIESKKMIVLK